MYFGDAELASSFTLVETVPGVLFLIGLLEIFSLMYSIDSASEKSL